MCIDALQFLDAMTATQEISRLLAPNGVAVVTTWEMLIDRKSSSEDLPPTLVCDYRTYFEAAGLRLIKFETPARPRTLELKFFRAMLERANELRAEMPDGANLLLHEADAFVARVNEPRRTRKVFIVVQKG